LNQRCRRGGTCRGGGRGRGTGVFENLVAAIVAGMNVEPSTTIVNASLPAPPVIGQNMESAT